MKKLNQICCLAFVMASLTYGDPVKRLNVHDLFHTIWNRNLDRSDVTIQMLSRSSDEPLTTGNIQLPHLDAENVFVPLSSDVDEEYKETTVR